MTVRSTFRSLSLLCCLVIAAPAAWSQAAAPSGDDLAAQVGDWDRARLETEAAARSDVLTDLSDQLDQAEEELAAAPDDAELGARVEDLEGRLATAAVDLRLVVNALDDAGGDVAELRAQLIAVQGAQGLEDLDAGAMMSLVEGWIEDGKVWLAENAPGLIVKAVVFLAVLLLFKVLAGFAARVVRRALSSSRLRVSDLLQTFFVNTARKLVFFIGVLVAFSAVGTDLTPILAGFGIFGFVLGFALQDTLGNFAAGLMILLYRPFDVGDVVEAGGVTGKVDNLSLVSTTMLTPDNQKVIVPNGAIWGGTIRNVTANATRRVDLELGVGYGDDLDKAHAAITDVVTSHPLVLKEPAPTIEVSTLNASSVDFVVRPWSKTEDYWRVYFDLTKQLKERCDAEGLNIPYPQTDVHLHQVAAAD